MRRLVLLMIISLFAFGKMEFADPKPTFDNPRKWVIKMNFNDIHRVNETLGAIYNVLKEYPSDSLKVAVVCYGKGMRVIKKDYDAHTLKRIKSLMAYDVEFVACKNTMATMKWTKKDIIDDVTYVQAGIAEVIERVADGWIDVTPY